MNALDYIIIVIIGFCFIRGLFRGLIKELSSILGVFAGSYVSYAYYEIIAEMIKEWHIIENAAYIKIISFFIIFCGVFFIVSIIGVILRYILKIMFLKWVDFTFGGGFGFAKGGLITIVIFITLTSLLPENSTIITESILAPYMTTLSERAIEIVPDDIKNKFNDNIAHIKEFWNKET